MALKDLSPLWLGGEPTAMLAQQQAVTGQDVPVPKLKIVKFGFRRYQALVGS
jgi:hypothetical protein